MSSDPQIPHMIDETRGSVPVDPSRFRDETRMPPQPFINDATPFTKDDPDDIVNASGKTVVPGEAVRSYRSPFDLPSQRPSLDQTFMDIAWLWAARGTCNRAQVGAVLARDGRQLMAGYNGAPPGMPHCNHTDDEPCTTAVHDAANLIGHAARVGVAVDGATFYSTHSPCNACALLLISAGIKRVVYAWPYRIRTDELLREAGVTVEKFQ